MNDMQVIIISLNTRVELELVDSEGGSEELSFDLVEDTQADYYAGFLGTGTPLAKAILGQVAGSWIDYQVGDIVGIRILSVRKSSRQAEDRAAARQDTIRRVVALSELKDRIAVATSVDNKWGDYDPAGLLNLLDQQMPGPPEAPGDMEEVE